MKTDDLIAGLPGEAMVRRGLADYRAGLCTAEALLVQIARPRLSSCGLLPPISNSMDEHELQLYRLLKAQGGDAYARYNALLGELVSFEMALDRRLRIAIETASAIVTSIPQIPLRPLPSFAPELR